jgi:hypothetical protein
MGGAFGADEALLDPTGVYDVTLQAVGSATSGPASASVAVVAAVPQITHVQYATAASPQVTVTWNAAELQHAHGVTGYQVRLLENGTGVGTPTDISGPSTGTATITLTAALRPWKAYTVTVRATGALATGPSSDLATVIVSAPEVTQTGINGAAWHLAWQSAAESAVTGYTVTVTDAAGGNAQTFHTASPGFKGPNGFTQNQCMASVYAVSTLAQGPPGAAANLYGAQPSYYFSSPGSANPGYLFLAAARPPAAAAITLYLPDVFTQTPTVSSPVFQLTKPATSAVYPYLITIAADSVAWKFDTASRSTLWQAYIQFLKDLFPVLRLGGLNLIAQVLGRSLPLLFSEQLGYVYRFNAASAYIDLVPGMRVRLDSEARQYVGPPSASNTSLSGFVSAGTTYLEVGEYWQSGSLNLGFNSYLSLAARPAVPGTANTGGAGGGIDLYPPLDRHPLYRLLYPQDFPQSNGFGHADMTDGMLIVGANTFADLEGATQQYIQNHSCPKQIMTLSHPKV